MDKDIAATKPTETLLGVAQECKELVSKCLEGINTVRSLLVFPEPTSGREGPSQPEREGANMEADLRYLRTKLRALDYGIQEIYERIGP